MVTVTYQGIAYEISPKSLSWILDSAAGKDVGPADNQIQVDWNDLHTLLSDKISESSKV